MVTNSWNETDSSTIGFKEKLRRWRECIVSWNEHNFGNVRDRIKTLKNELKSLKILIDQKKMQKRKNICQSS